MNITHSIHNMDFKNWMRGYIEGQLASNTSRILGLVKIELAEFTVDGKKDFVTIRVIPIIRKGRTVKHLLLLVCAL